MGDALGLIETKGLVACIEAADSMCKAANVELIGYENVGSGLVTAMVKATSRVTAAVRLRRGSGETHWRSRQLSRHRASP